MKLQHAPDLFPIGRFQFLEEKHAGIVHHNVRQDAGFFPTPRIQPLGCILAGQILEMGGNRHGECGPERLRCRIQLFFPVAHQDDIVTFPGQLPGKLQPHAGAAASNEGRHREAYL